MRCAARSLLLVAFLGSPAFAYDFEPVKPLDVSAIDPALLADVFGAYEIRDESGRKRCRINLMKEPGIGGYQLDMEPGCDRAFPVMSDIGAWRLMEGWMIDLVDPLRKTRLRFETPDNRYVAIGDEKDIAGMHELIKLPSRASPKKK